MTNWVPIGWVGPIGSDREGSIEQQLYGIRGWEIAMEMGSYVCIRRIVCVRRLAVGFEEVSDWTGEVVDSGLRW